MSDRQDEQQEYRISQQQEGQRYLPQTSVWWQTNTQPQNNQNTEDKVKQQVTYYKQVQKNNTQVQSDKVQRLHNQKLIDPTKFLQQDKLITHNNQQNQNKILIKQQCVQLQNQTIQNYQEKESSTDDKLLASSLCDLKNSQPQIRAQLQQTILQQLPYRDLHQKFEVQEQANTTQPDDLVQNLVKRLGITSKKQPTQCKEKTPKQIDFTSKCTNLDLEKNIYKLLSAEQYKQNKDSNLKVDVSPKGELKVNEKSLSKALVLELQNLCKISQKQEEKEPSNKIAQNSFKADFRKENQCQGAQQVLDNISASYMTQSYETLDNQIMKIQLQKGSQGFETSKQVDEGFKAQTLQAHRAEMFKSKYMDQQRYGQLVSGQFDRQKQQNIQLYPHSIGQQQNNINSVNKFVLDQAFIKQNGQDLLNETYQKLDLGTKQMINSGLDQFKSLDTSQNNIKYNKSQEPGLDKAYSQTCVGQNIALQQLTQYLKQHQQNLKVNNLCTQNVHTSGQNKIEFLDNVSRSGVQIDEQKDLEKEALKMKLSVSRDFRLTRLQDANNKQDCKAWEQGKSVDKRDLSHDIKPLCNLSQNKQKDNQKDQSLVINAYLQQLLQEQDNQSKGLKASQVTSNQCSSFNNQQLYQNTQNMEQQQQVQMKQLEQYILNRDQYNDRECQKMIKETYEQSLMTQGYLDQLLMVSNQQTQAPVDLKDGSKIVADQLQQQQKETKSQSNIAVDSQVSQAQIKASVPQEQQNQHSWQNTDADYNQSKYLQQLQSQPYKMQQQAVPSSQVIQQQCAMSQAIQSSQYMQKAELDKIQLLLNSYEQTYTALQMGKQKESLNNNAQAQDLQQQSQILDNQLQQIEKVKQVLLQKQQLSYQQQKQQLQQQDLQQQQQQTLLELQQQQDKNQQIKNIEFQIPSVLKDLLIQNVKQGGSNTVQKEEPIPIDPQIRNLWQAFRQSDMKKSDITSLHNNALNTAIDNQDKFNSIIKSDYTNEQPVKSQANGIQTNVFYDIQNQKQNKFSSPIQIVEQTEKQDLNYHKNIYGSQNLALQNNQLSMDIIVSQQQQTSNRQEVPINFQQVKQDSGVEQRSHLNSNNQAVFYKTPNNAQKPELINLKPIFQENKSLSYNITHNPSNANMNSVQEIQNLVKSLPNISIQKNNCTRQKTGVGKRLNAARTQYVNLKGQEIPFIESGKTNAAKSRGSLVKHNNWHVQKHNNKFIVNRPQQLQQNKPAINLQQDQELNNHFAFSAQQDVSIDQDLPTLSMKSLEVPISKIQTLGVDRQVQNPYQNMQSLSDRQTKFQQHQNDIPQSNQNNQEDEVLEKTQVQVDRYKNPYQNQLYTVNHSLPRLQNLTEVLQGEKFTQSGNLYSSQLQNFVNQPSSFTIPKQKSGDQKTCNEKQIQSTNLQLQPQKVSGQDLSQVMEPDNDEHQSLSNFQESRKEQQIRMHMVGENLNARDYVYNQKQSTQVQIKFQQEKNKDEAPIYKISQNELGNNKMAKALVDTEVIGGIGSEGNIDELKTCDGKISMQTHSKRKRQEQFLISKKRQYISEGATFPMAKMQIGNGQKDIVGKLQSSYSNMHDDQIKQQLGQPPKFNCYGQYAQSLKQFSPFDPTLKSQKLQNQAQSVPLSSEEQVPEGYMLKEQNSGCNHNDIDPNASLKIIQQTRSEQQMQHSAYQSGFRSVACRQPTLRASYPQGREFSQRQQKKEYRQDQEIRKGSGNFLSRNKGSQLYQAVVPHQHVGVQGRCDYQDEYKAISNPYDFNQQEYGQAGTMHQPQLYQRLILHRSQSQIQRDVACVQKFIIQSLETIRGFNVLDYYTKNIKLLKIKLEDLKIFGLKLQIQGCLYYKSIELEVHTKEQSDASNYIQIQQATQTLRKLIQDYQDCTKERLLDIKENLDLFKHLHQSQYRYQFAQGQLKNKCVQIQSITKVWDQHRFIQLRNQNRYRKNSGKRRLDKMLLQNKNSRKGMPQKASIVSEQRFQINYPSQSRVEQGNKQQQSRKQYQQNQLFEQQKQLQQNTFYESNLLSTLFEPFNRIVKISSTPYKEKHETKGYMESDKSRLFIKQLKDSFKVIQEQKYNQNPLVQSNVIDQQIFDNDIFKQKKERVCHQTVSRSNNKNQTIYQKGIDPGQQSQQDSCVSSNKLEKTENDLTVSQYSKSTQPKQVIGIQIQIKIEINKFWDSSTSACITDNENIQIER